MAGMLRSGINAWGKITSAGLPDPYTPPDGDWDVTGSISATVDISAASFTGGTMSCTTLVASTSITMGFTDKLILDGGDAHEYITSLSNGKVNFYASSTHVFEMESTAVSCKTDFIVAGDDIYVKNSNQLIAQAADAGELQLSKVNGGGAGLITTTTGNLQLSPAASVVSAAPFDLDYAGAGDALNIALATNAGSQAIVITEDAQARAESLFTITTDAARTGVALNVDNFGSNNAISVQNYGTAAALRASVATDLTNYILYATEDNVARSTEMFFLQRQSSATGDVVFIDNNATATSRSISIDHESSAEAIYIQQGGNNFSLYAVQTGDANVIGSNNQGSGGSCFRGYLNTATDNYGITLTEDNIARSVSMVNLTRQPLCTGNVVTINNDSTTSSRSIDIDHESTGVAVYVHHVAGNGNWAFYSASGKIGGARGYYLDLSGDNGEYIYSSADDNLDLHAGTIINFHLGGTKVARFASAGFALYAGQHIFLYSGEPIVFNSDGNYDTYIQGSDTTLDLVADSTTVLSSTATLMTASVGMKFVDGASIRFGSSNDSYIKYQTGQTNDAVMWALSADSMTLILHQYGDDSTDFAHAAKTNPTVIWQAADHTDITKFGAISRNDDDFVIEVGAGGAGDLYLSPDGVVKFGTHTAIGAETVTGFITIKDAGGTTRKLAVVS